MIGLCRVASANGDSATIAAYALIALCRLLFTPNSFKKSKFSLGPFAKPFYIITFVWNLVVFAVSMRQAFHYVAQLDVDLFPIFAENSRLRNGT